MLRPVLFLLFSASFLLHQYLQKIKNIPIGLADNYLDSLTVMPILLTAVRWERKWLFHKGPSYRLPTRDIAGYFLIVILFAEIIFPALSDSFTADPLDALTYLAGSLIFSKWMNDTPAYTKAKADS